MDDTKELCILSMDAKKLMIMDAKNMMRDEDDCCRCDVSKMTN